MVTYDYSLSASGPGSIQNVINNIIQELSTNPSISRDISIVLGP